MFVFDTGSRTPHYGSMTPSHDPSRTPLHGGAWDPTQPNTPARNDDFDYGFDASTPSPAVSKIVHDDNDGGDVEDDYDDHYCNDDGINGYYDGGDNDVHCNNDGSVNYDFRIMHQTHQTLPPPVPIRDRIHPILRELVCMDRNQHIHRTHNRRLRQDTETR